MVKCDRLKSEMEEVASAATSDNSVSREGKMRKRRVILVAIVVFGLIAAHVVVSVAVPPNVTIRQLKNIEIPETDFSFNPATEQLEGSGSDDFQVEVKRAGAANGIVAITSVTCPITGITQPGNSAGYLSAYLSRNYLVLPSPSITDVTLTVWVRVPLTVAAGNYKDGLVEITATAAFW